MFRDNLFTLETNASPPIYFKSIHTKIKLNSLKHQHFTSPIFPSRGWVVVVAEPRRSASVEMALNPLINPLLTSFH